MHPAPRRPRQRDLAEIQRRADDAGIGNARLNGVRDLAEHTQLAARGRWRQVDSPVGPVPALLPPALACDWTPVAGPVPALGADTDAIRAEVTGRSGAAQDLSERTGHHAHPPAVSKTAARPWPPPMHIVSSP